VAQQVGIASVVAVGAAEHPRQAGGEAVTNHEVHVIGRQAVAPKQLAGNVGHGGTERRDRLPGRDLALVIAIDYLRWADTSTIPSASTLAGNLAPSGSWGPLDGIRPNPRTELRRAHVTRSRAPATRFPGPAVSNQASSSAPPAGPPHAVVAQAPENRTVPYSPAASGGASLTVEPC
jgi:hypothetical protein